MLLEASDVTVRFAGLVALENVNISITSGALQAVIGPNGAGKTTLFNVLSGFISPTGGSIRFRGRMITRLAPSARARMGLARTFQQGGLWKTETALANLLMAQSSPAQLGSFRSVIALGRSEHLAEYRRKTIGEEVLQILRLEDYQDVPVHLMPYGSRKVLELGCALVSRPKLLLLDEPAAGMTEEESNWLAGVISDIRSELGMTVLIIEHHVPLIKRIAEHVDVLNFGKTIASGTPAEVTGNRAVLEAYLGRGATPRQMKTRGNGVASDAGGEAANKLLRGKT